MEGVTEGENSLRRFAHVENRWGKPFDEWGLELREMLLGTGCRVASLAARDAEGMRAHATSGLYTRNVGGLGRAICAVLQG